MVIQAGGLVMDLQLTYLSEFLGLEKYETIEEPTCFLKVLQILPSFSKKKLIKKTKYFELYETNLGFLQCQYVLDKWIGSLLYCQNTVYMVLGVSHFEVEYLLSQYAFVYWIKNNTAGLYIHGSSIWYEESGLLFCAKSGVGKSTQRRLWEQYGGAICINDDKNVLCCSDHNIEIIPNPWSGKHFKNTNLSASLRAIIFIARSKENWVEELTADQAFPLLFPQIELPSFEGKETFNDLLDEMLKLPLLRLHCNMDAEAFYCLEKELRTRGVFNETKKK